jgi:hypothetical protein
VIVLIGQRIRAANYAALQLKSDLGGACRTAWPWLSTARAVAAGALVAHQYVHGSPPVVLQQPRPVSGRGFGFNWIGHGDHAFQRFDRHLPG